MSNDTSLYLECSSGISGDMFVAAMLDLGADKNVLQKVLNSMPLHGFTTEISTVKKNGLEATDFNVILDRDHENHDHDMDYLYGHDVPLSENGCPDHDHSHVHVHRTLKDIYDIIDRTQMSSGSAVIARHIFSILGAAEAEAHGTSAENVHFHEIGAVDSIADIISAAVCFDNLNIEKVIIPVLCEGTGRIRCAHGILPVPVPAVVNIVKANGLNLHIMESDGEHVTPTGAAIAAALKTSDRLPSSFRIISTGTGAGKRTYPDSCILRAMLIEESDIPDIRKI